MKRKPEESRGRLLTPQILAKSVLQGIAIAIASFAVYFFHLKNCPDRAVVSRSMGLMVIMISNLFLVLVNCSDSESALRSLFRLLKDRGMQDVYKRQASFHDRH